MISTHAATTVKFAGVTPQQPVRVLPPEVMKSQAGFYVGCYSEEDGLFSPYSRLSQYFTKGDDAALWLTRAQTEGVI